MLLSFIVPVYNTGKYLDDCIKCILNQQGNDYELILVDDGSYDEITLNILEKYSYDEKVHIISKKNTGVSDTRNIGIKQSVGKYILFVDSDDIIVDNLLSYIRKETLYNEPDMFIGMMKTIKKTGDVKSYKINREIKRIDNSMNLFDDLFINKLFVGSACNYVIKRDVLIQNNVKFDIKKRYTEDIDFILALLKYTENYKVMNFIHYYYRKNNTSATAYISRRRINDNFDTINKWVDENRVIKSKYLEDFLAYQFYIVLGMSYLCHYEVTNLDNYYFLLKSKLSWKTYLCSKINKCFGLRILIICLAILLKIKKVKCKNEN